MKKVTRTLFLTVIIITALTVSKSYAHTATIGIPIYSDLTHLTQNVPLTANDAFSTDILRLSQQLELLLEKILGHDFGNTGSNDGWQGGGAPGTGNSSQNAPLDGGVILLLIAGLALGTKMVMDRNNALQKQKVSFAHIVE